MDNELKEKGLLGLDGKVEKFSSNHWENLLFLGFRNMLLSQNFDIVKPLFSRQIYQNMTR